MFFKYIAKSFVRKFFFGKTTMIWYNEMAAPDALLLFQDGIDMSRIEGDLIREDLLHYHLVDLVRNPETMVSLGGSMLKRRLNAETERKEAITEEKKVFFG